MAQRHVTQGLECTKPVCQRATHCGEGSLGRDEPLLLLCIASIANFLHFVEVGTFEVVFLHHVEHLYHHRLDYEAVVVVEVEVLTVAIPTVALIPLFVAGECVGDALKLTLAGELIEGSLNHCREEQPVGL